ncbi:MAG: Ig-like domain-containing protein, partial [Clostridiaceae bacterium]|nr:Ig-like domain-containing protein [Clostridiaceae bacterium]
IGYNGTKGFQFLQNVLTTTDVVRYAYITTKEVELGDDDVLILDYKINIKNFGESPSSFRLGCINSNSIQDSIFMISDNYIKVAEGYGSEYEDYYCQTDTWYTVVLKITPTEQTGYLLDEAGDVLIKVDREIDAGSTIKIYPINLEGGSPESPDRSLDREVIIDDVNLYRIAPDTYALNIDSDASTPDGAILEVNAEVTIAFNQPVIPNKGEIISLYSCGMQVTAEYKISNDGVNAIKIKFTQPLTYFTEYELKYEGIQGLAGNVLEGEKYVFFTTEDVDVMGVTSQPNILSNGTVSAGNINLAVKNVGEQIQAAFIVAMYENPDCPRLMGVEVFSSTVVPSGQNDIPLTLSGSYQNIEMVKIFAFESIDNISPLMKDYVVIELTEGK